jgi:hypothetical protein
MKNLEVETMFFLFFLDTFLFFCVKLNTVNTTLHYRLRKLAETKKTVKVAEQQKLDKLPCGCVYQDKGWVLTRVSECEYHKRKRTTKRPYRPKAECVRP